MFFERSICDPLRLVATVAVCLAASACSGDYETPPPPSEDRGGHVMTHAPAGPCESGETRSCTETIELAFGVKSCFEGLQLCVDGAWGDCTDPELFERQLEENMGGASGAEEQIAD